MQWIKTLIMFLALFWGSDALSAKSQFSIFAKHAPTTHSPLAITHHSPSQEIACTNQDKSFLITRNTPDNHQLNNHTKRQKTKYRCGHKRRKNIHQRYRISQGRNQNTLILKNSNHSLSEECPALLPEAVLNSRHRSLCVIAPRE